MTHAARDERDSAPYDGTLAGGPEGQAFALDTPPPRSTRHRRTLASTRR